MAEKLCELKKKGGGGGSIILNVQADGSSGSNEHYGIVDITGSEHSYKKINVLSYINLSASHANYPSIKIGGTTYNRPTVGTVFDVEGKDISIISLTNVGNYTRSGIKVELS